MTRLAVAAAVLGATDAIGLGHFYAGLLGWPIVQESPEWFSIVGPRSDDQPVPAQPVLRIPAAMPLMVSSSARSRSGSSSPRRYRPSSSICRWCNGSR